MIIQGINFIVMAVGACFWYPRLIGTACNCALSCCHLAAWITIFAARFSPLGNYCNLNIAGNQMDSDGRFDDTWTYKKEGGLMVSFGIMQALLFCCQCCFWIPLKNTPQQGDFDKDKKKDKKDKDKKKDKNQDG